MRVFQRGGDHFPQTTVKDTSPHTDARPHRWLPSLSAMIWITLFLGLNLTSARIVLISADETMWKFFSHYELPAHDVKVGK